jgi:hypothetical protein
VCNTPDFAVIRTGRNKGKEAKHGENVTKREQETNKLKRERRKERKKENGIPVTLQQYSVHE